MVFYVARVECWSIYMTWNENDSLLKSFELWSLYMVVVQGYDHTLPLGAVMAFTVLG